MAKAPYQPPEQSRVGQLVDTFFLFALVVASLFIPVYLGLAGGGKTDIQFTDKTWAGMGQNAVMQAQWEKLGFTPDTAAPIIASRFDYAFDPIALGITALVVVGYFVFVFRMSEKEYREVIAERFDNGEVRR
jgi:hypothetical protein